MRRVQTTERDNRTSGSLLEFVVAECRHPARLIELYYSCMEPDLLATLRAIAAMPPATRAQLAAFLQVQNPHETAATIEPNGDIRLRSTRGRATTRAAA